MPRLIRLSDATFYLGMDKNRFNELARPELTKIPIGNQGVAFDRQYVFTFKGEPVQRINGSAWRKTRERTGLAQCHVHDLRHTFENWQDLLGHKSGMITDHYCKAEAAGLREAVEKLSRVTKIAGIKKPVARES